MSTSIAKTISPSITYSHSVSDEYFYCPLHTHDTLEMYFFISGNCEYLVEGTTYKLLPGDILIMRPVEAHCTRVLTMETSYERMVFDIDVSFFEHYFGNREVFDNICNQPLGTNNQFRDADFGHKMCKEMLYQLVEKELDAEDNEVISRVLYILSEVNNVLKSRSLSFNADSTDKLIEFVNQNLFRDLSLDMICDEFFMSKSQINRIFKKKTGSSIYQYILAKRLLTAKNMIASGEPTGEVSEKCGFSDYSSFYRSYTKRFGHPPKQDKKQQP